MARQSSKPPATFSFLGIPCGDEIEFRYKDEGIFIDDPEETFTVANQDHDQDRAWIRGREVTWVNKAGWATDHSLSDLTAQLWDKRNKKMNTKLKMPWTHLLWFHCKTQRLLADIYHKK